jgi:hypothetical protein
MEYIVDISPEELDRHSIEMAEIICKNLTKLNKEYYDFENMVSFKYKFNKKLKKNYNIKDIWIKVQYINDCDKRLRISGWADRNWNDIVVEIISTRQPKNIFNNISKRKQKRIFNNICNVIRHEIQHLIQNYISSCEFPGYKFSDYNLVKKYNLDPEEVDAYVYGEKLLARLQKKGFEYKIQKLAKFFVKDLKKNKETLHKEIVNEYMKYAKEVGLIKT